VAGLFIASFGRPSYLASDHTVSTHKPPESHAETTQKRGADIREQVLAMLKSQPNLSTKALAQHAGLSLYSVRHHLEALKASGRIRHVGPSKSGYWEIL
jgi:ATP-dependent DNA helicase RecG